MSTRTRSRQISEIFALQPMYVLTGPSTSRVWTFAGNTDIYTRWKFKEQFTDSLGRDGRMRACVHRKAYYSFQGDLYSDQVYLDPSSGPSGVRNAAMQHQRREHLAMQDLTFANAVAPSSIDWEGIAADAKQNMLPSIDGGNSLLNSLYELKDFKHLLRSLDRLFATTGVTLRALFERFKDVFSAAWGAKPWQSRPQKVSAAYLAWKFAWAPFVADLKSLIKSMISFKEKIRQLEVRENQAQQRYWGKTYPATYVGDGWTQGAQSFSGPGIARSSTVRSRNPGEVYRCTAVMRYKYKLPPEVKKAAGLIGAFLDTLGINANPSIVWNAIPFTFVVDWFYDVGDFLERFTVRNVRPITEITDFCVSVKAKRTLRADTTMRLFGDSLATATKIISTIGEASYYERRLVNPNIWSFNDTPTGLSGTQLALSGALISVNLPSGKGPRRSTDNNWMWK